MKKFFIAEVVEDHNLPVGETALLEWGVLKNPILTLMITISFPWTRYDIIMLTV